MDVAGLGLLYPDYLELNISNVSELWSTDNFATFPPRNVLAIPATDVVISFIESRIYVVLGLFTARNSI